MKSTKGFQFAAFIVILGLLTSCHNQTNDQTVTTTSKVDSTQIYQQQKDEAANQKKWVEINSTVLPDTLRKTIVDYFSNSTTKDTIALIVPSGHITETKSRFYISNSQGKLLYNIEFDTKQFIDGYDFDEEYKANQTVKYYQDKVSAYFGDGDTLLGYSKGKGNDMMDTTYFIDDTSRLVWNEIKDKPKLKYTYLSLEEENTVLIFYSPSLGKAIEVFACC